MQYRRAKTKGGTYFFTLVTRDRRKVLCRPANVSLLREAFHCVMAEQPIQVECFHYNPVKHEAAEAPGDWPYSSFHRYVRQGVCSEGWRVGREMVFAASIANE